MISTTVGFDIEYIDVDARTIKVYLNENSERRKQILLHYRCTQCIFYNV